MILAEHLIHDVVPILVALIMTLPALLSAVAVFLVRKNHKAIDTPGAMTLGETVAATNRAVLDHGVQLNELRNDLNDHVSNEAETLKDVQKTLHDHVNTEEPLLLESRARMADLQETVDTHLEEDHKFFAKIFGILGDTEPDTPAVKKATAKKSVAKKSTTKRLS